MRMWLTVPILAAVVSGFIVARRAIATPPPCRYVVTASGSGSGTVRDAVTGLTWQQTPSSSLYDWTGAQTFCQQLTYAGFSSGWRAPAFKELLSIVDYTRANPAIDTTTFAGSTTASYWSSSAYVSGLDMGWSVEFGAGSGQSAANTAMNSVRCVR